ncbi:MAG: alanine--glyoxylate aminotransferase family protein [Bryobacterales bacterium]|nr:alanine--glyoxylate aminotransferase family protein [Bryobacterales bacterium]
MSQTTCTLSPPKRLLMGPGPSMVEPRVYAAMAQPIVGHLDPYFFQISEEIRGLLATAFGTSNQFTMAISGTGSAGMEACVSNFVEDGSKMAVLANGFFCDRLSELGRRQGASVVRLEKPWGEVFDAGEARDFIKREKPGVVAYVMAETSTGAVQPGKAICEAAHEVGALVVADCVTALGTMPCNLDETGIDAAYSCTQKGLGAPPGLAPVSISPRALETLRGRTTSHKSWYFDLKLLDEYYGSAHRYHHTAPISMFYALREALEIIREEGLPARFARHERNHKAFVAGLEAMGLRMFVAPQHRMWALNTPCVPEGVTDLAIRKRLMDGDGIEILGGFGPLAGKVFRIGIMGAGSREENVLLLLDRMESALRAEGFTPRSNGVEAARAIYSA